VGCRRPARLRLRGWRVHPSVAHAEGVAPRTLPFTASEPPRATQEPGPALTGKRSRASGKPDRDELRPCGARGTSGQRSHGWRVQTRPSVRYGAPGETAAVLAPQRARGCFRPRLAAPRAPCPPSAALRAHRTCPGPPSGAASTR
jgi:hypothetical protein